MSSGDLDRLVNRAKAAWSIADIEHSALREVYRWMWPDRYFEMVGGGQHTGNSTGGDRARYNHIFDPTGMQALADGAAQVAEAVHPWDQPWARWVSRSDLDEAMSDEAAELADFLTRAGLSLLNRSNFHTEATAAHRDFLVGTGMLGLELDPRERTAALASAIPAYRVALEADNGGRWTGFFRKYKRKARDLDGMFADKVTWSGDVQKKQREKPEEEIELEYAWYWSQEDRAWRSCGWETATRHEFRKSLHRTSPIVCYRATRTAGRPWSSGPAAGALPDVKTANKVVELILRNAALAVAGVWMADDDGVLNPATVKIGPGVVIPKAQGSAGLTPLEMPGRFDVASLVLEDLRVNIRRALYVTKIQEREMTAEEYRGRLMQQVRDMRGMYGQLRSEFVVPVMRRTLDLNIEIGTVPEQEWDRLVDIEMVGPLAQDARAAEVDRLVQAQGVVGQLVGPELAMAALNAHEAVPWVVKQMHIKAELFKSREDLKAFGEQVMQLAAQAAAAMMVEGMQGGAEQQESA